MRFLGIDYGSKKIGLAVSDETAILAFPFKVVTTTSGVVAKIKKICEEKEISKIVLGESLDFKGKPNPVMEEIEKFKILLEKETGLSVIFETEILTTKQAAASQPELKEVDASAAALIFQGYLDRINRKVL